MRVISSVDFTIAEKDGKEVYILNEQIVYTSPRYNKTVTVPAGYISDGATGAMDIASRAWFVHDQLCDSGKWDDGTPLSNWQCSTVLYDILKEEGRNMQAIRWRVATWLFGGGQARKNGMFKVAATLSLLTLIAGCSTINVTVSGRDNKISIEQPRTVGVSPSLDASGSTVPISAMP